VTGFVRGFAFGAVVFGGFALAVLLYVIRVCGS
jgi:hypothetical protein